LFFLGGEGASSFESSKKTMAAAASLEDAEGTDGLRVLQQLLEEVYQPIFADPAQGQRVLVSDTIRSDFQGNVSKFATSIAHTIQQVDGGIRLAVPSGIITGHHDPAVHADDPEVVARVEVAVNSWIPLVSKVVHDEQEKEPEGSGPLAEIEFWRARNALVAPLHENCFSDEVESFLAVLEVVGDSPALHAFLNSRQELTRLFHHAKDNVKFLATLERHFKTVEHGSIVQIQETLPSMMNALRMVWIISRYYNRPATMTQLLRRIASALAAKVREQVDITTVFSATDAEDRIQESRDLLKQWKVVFNGVRQRIEQSGSDDRWDFDRQALFEVTDYMVDRCRELHEVAHSVSHFRGVLGADLKAVTGEHQRIEEVLKHVEGAVRAIETIPFDVFDKRYETSWETVMERFSETIKAIDASAKKFIDQSFADLRSAEGAFDLLLNFWQQLGETGTSSDDAGEATGPRIDQQMLDKFTDVLKRYHIEVRKIDLVFDTHKDAPMVSPSLPPVAGAIAWSRQLFERLKRPIVRFKQTLPEMLDNDYGREVTRDYVALGRKMRDYEEALIKQWSSGVDSRCLSLLKNTVLAFDSDQRHVRVNFPPELLQLIHETQLLDSMNFKVPETAISVALQEEKYSQFRDMLEAMIGNYHAVISSIEDQERLLLAPLETRLKITMQAGLQQLNWNSLGIVDFVETAATEIGIVSSLLNQVKKNMGILVSITQAIANAEVVPVRRFRYAAAAATLLALQKGEQLTEPLRGEVVDMQEFQEGLEHEIEATVPELVRQYRTMGSLISKVEHIIAADVKDDARSLQRHQRAMEEFYKLWERRVYNALVHMVISNLDTLRSLLCLDGKPSIIPPLFPVQASLSAPEVVISPSLQDLSRFMMRSTLDVVNATKPFLRWMDGTCQETPQLSPKEGDDIVVYTFHSDVSVNRQVVDLVRGCQESAAEVVDMVLLSVDEWRRYSFLWPVDKQPTLDRFAARNPGVVAYDTKMTEYSNAAEHVRSRPVELNHAFVHINCLPLQNSIVHECDIWLQSFGALLYKSAKSELTALHEHINQTEVDLNRRPETMDDLKFILRVIERVSEESMDIELRYADLEERMQTLETFKVDEVVSADDARVAEGLRARWENILRRAVVVDEELVTVKAGFTQTTKRQVEVFTGKVGKFRRKFLKVGPASDACRLDLEAGYACLHKFREDYARFCNIRDELVLAEKLFNLAITAYPDLVEIGTELQELDLIYNVYTDQKEKISAWAATLWSELDMSSLTTGIEEIEKTLSKFPEVAKRHAPFDGVSLIVKDFKNSLPLISLLKSDALRTRHWKRLMEVTGQVFQVNHASFTLESIFKMELNKFTEAIEDIVAGASKELSIESGLAAIAETWGNQRLDVVEFTSGTQEKRFVLKGVDEIIELYDDNVMTLQGMSASRFVKPFQTELQKWENQLSIIAEVLEEWIQVQRKWIYLENVFLGGDDIRMQLPEEAKLFDRVNKGFMKIMIETSKNTLVIDCCKQDRLELLKSLAQQMEVCQKSLSEYLYSKRSSFARFFFISDDELLSIIGGGDPTLIQEHVTKLFDNVESLKFGKVRNRLCVLGMNSVDKEELDFRQPVTVEGNVESWMTEVEAEMKRTLHALTRESVGSSILGDRFDWIDQTKGQVTLLTNDIWWTWNVEYAFNQVREQGDKHAVKKLLAELGANLNELVDEVRKDMPIQMRKKINTLVILDVHARDVVDRLVRDSVLDPLEFAWESQLRFYWDKLADDVSVRQCTGRFEYSYEYLGLNNRLVITPLTERCIMTLTQALSMKLGGSPAGPAGTGKTETVKDLSKALGLQCVVFNCSEGLDSNAMSGIFSGLCQCGAWGCFDEFNRIDPGVLSIISVQLKSVQTALKADASTFHFSGSGRDIPLDSRCGFFITMNPHYKGRSELPDNLKALFRPVVMVVPDLELICEIMMLSEGFQGAKVLAKKMTVLYAVAKEQLSKQDHYDFGLRTMKAVLMRAGSLKRSSPSTDEAMILVTALRDMNVPRFIFDDVPLFQGLLRDLWPGLEVPPMDDEEFKTAVEESLQEGDYQVVPEQVDRIVQLYETMKTRHTTMVVGPTGSGKSVVIQMLAKAHSKLGRPTKLKILNPKAQTVNELYGVLDPNTRDWTDGLLSFMFREINRVSPGSKTLKNFRHIVFDGDVDTVWVENMNSVMDDSKTLTLPNGERIRLQPHCSLMFEVADLKQASPATVSRCGMVYLDPRNLGYWPFVERWLKTSAVSSSRKGQRVLKKLFDKYLDPVMDFIYDGIINGEVVNDEKLPTIIPVTNVSMTQHLCAMLEMSLTPGATNSKLAPGAAFDLEEGGADGAEMELDDVFADEHITEAFFLFSVVWSCGATLEAEGRVVFDGFLKRIARLHLIDANECGVGELPIELPTLFDYFIDSLDFKWKPWTQHATKREDDATDMASAPQQVKNFHDVIVPTSDTIRTTWMVEHSIRIGKPILLVGASGTAKTKVVQNLFSSLSREKFSTLTLNFSSRTAAQDVQVALEAVVERWSRGVYGPAAGKKLVIFLDDLNMPVPDIYGTMQALALLKLLIERGGYYDRGGELNWKELRNVHFVAAMGPPGGGRHEIDPRFAALFNVVNVPVPRFDVVHQIYDTFLFDHLQPFHDGIKEAAGTMTQASIRLFKAVTTRLLPTPAKFHYLFSLRDLSRLFEGLCLASLDKVGSPEALVRLWRNEAVRTFEDRLITIEDRQFILREIKEIVGDLWPEHSESALEEPILFGDYVQFGVDTTANGESAVFEDYGSYDRLRLFFEDALESYNEQHTTMDLVLFDEALEHLNRILRIIRRPHGNALLVGITGCGKSSLARLAAHVAGYDLFEITLSRSYGLDEFREDLKDLYRRLGSEDRKTVFLFTESHLANEGFLEFINNMLTIGIVPALFDEEEKKAVVRSVEDEVVAQGIFDSKENCWNYFVEKAANNLHIVLSLSPGDALRERCRNFPGLVSSAVIDWFDKWPEDALRAVAQAQLEPAAHSTESLVPKGLVDELVDHVILAHNDAEAHAEELSKRGRHSYVTPKNFLDFVHGYLELLSTNNKKLNDAHERFGSGLTKLEQAAVQIQEMNIVLKKQKIVVDEKTEQNTELLEQISENKEKVEKQQALATAKQRELRELQGQILTKKEEAEEALAEALPALELAREALKHLRREDVTELRSFAQPHEAVQNVAQCVCVFMGYKDPSWKTAKQMMTSITFLNDLLELNADALTSAQVKQVKDALKSLDVSLDKMRSISNAGHGLMMWVVATVKYCDVAKSVAPKRKAVKTAEIQLRQNEKDLEHFKSEVARLTKLLAELETTYEKGTKEQQTLKEEAETMERRLIAAKQLISGLGSERKRWNEEMAQIADQRTRLVGDCLLASGFMAYSSPFPFEFRQQMLTDWEADIVDREIPLTHPFSIVNLLTQGEVEVSAWCGQEGLPADSLSIQNGILATKGTRFPLCVDPQMQAHAWISKREAKHKLVTRTFQDPDFARQLELCITFGIPMLIDGVDETIDPLLDVVLEKSITTQGTRNFILLGDKEVDWNDNFRLYMTTKQANPRYEPRIFGKALVVNMNVTPKGLEDQLLTVVVGLEQPELEERRQTLVQETAENKSLLANFEDTLLRELATSKGNMLDNVDLIATLEGTKAKVNEVSEALQLAATTSAELNRLREQYRPAARRGATLYFVLQSISSIGPMYQYALSAFLQVFSRAIQDAKFDSDLDRRLENIIDSVTTGVYNFVCMGIFEKHKLTFSFQLAVAILRDRSALAKEQDEQALVHDHKSEATLPEAERLDESLFHFILLGNASLDKDGSCPYDYLSDQAWSDLQELARIVASSFPDASPLLENLKRHEPAWRAWESNETPERTPHPFSDTGAVGVNSMLLLLALIRCFRQDRLHDAISEFVIKTIGQKYTNPLMASTEQVWQLSAPPTPVLFVLSPGADPGTDVRALAEKHNFSGNKLKELALGQNQGKIAAHMIEAAAARGHWVMLHNCHLLVGWISELEKILLRVIDNGKPHADFRLFLTTEPHDRFPIEMLQRSLKVVTEPPDGLKLNLLGNYSRISEDLLESCPHPAFRSLVFVLAFFHAVVQERRKYGKSGWNIPYDFNESDFTASADILGTYLRKGLNAPSSKSLSSAADVMATIPWGSLRYLIGEVMYGGRVTDKYDRRILQTYLEEYLGEFVFDEFQKFAFYLSDSGDAEETVQYSIPSPGPLDSYVSHIESLPPVNSPNVFGLHSNAEILYHTNAARDLLRRISAMATGVQAIASANVGYSYVASLAADIESKQTPEPFKISRVIALRQGHVRPSSGRSEHSADPKEQEGLRPIDIVLVQELERFNALVAVMKDDVKLLQQALSGEVGISSALEELMESLTTGSTPSKWLRLSPPTCEHLSLAGFLRHTRRRSRQYGTWIEKGQPLSIWLSGIHVPESYLKALQQEAARKRGWPLDATAVSTEMTSWDEIPGDFDSSDFDGCFIQGLCLEGAAWDKRNQLLRAQQPREVLVDMPLLKVVPIASKGSVDRSGMFMTPVYSTPDRNDKTGLGTVFEADLNSDVHESLWALEGVSLILQRRE
jgi:dynein axonemal heavy chain